MYYDNIKDKLLNNLFPEYEDAVETIDSFQTELDYINSNCNTGDLPEDVHELQNWILLTLGEDVVYFVTRALTDPDATEDITDYICDEIMETCCNWTPCSFDSNNTIYVDIDAIKETINQIVEESECGHKPIWDPNPDYLDIVNEMNKYYPMKFAI